MSDTFTSTRRHLPNENAHHFPGSRIPLDAFTGVGATSLAFMVTQGIDWEVLWRRELIICIQDLNNFMLNNVHGCFSC